MTKIHCFKPMSRPDATVLLLGSMPGVRSLQQAQYYAHARNAFWPIMGALFGAAPELAYPERLRILRANRVALWDVLQCCERVGSLDADIAEASIVANDFAAFFKQHPDIGRVFFNGAKAEAAYKKYVLPTLPGNCVALRCVRLPSTSPAHAGFTLSQKLAQWRVVKDAV
jgi:double-stranded uracil-DNA glycosylase